MGTGLTTLWSTLWLALATGPLEAPSPHPTSLQHASRHEATAQTSERHNTEVPRSVALPPVVLAQAHAPALADPAGACRDVAIDRVQARYENAQDLAASFTQTTRAAQYGTAIAKPVESHGTMVVAKPGKMRWTYTAPEKSLVVSDGSSLWIYDPAFGEAQKLPVTEGYLSGAAVQFLLGTGDMRRDFTISEVSCDAKQAALELRPKEPASFEKLEIVVDPATGDLSETTVYDLLGNRIRVRFEELRVNQKPGDEVFRFEAPEGVQVIELTAP